MIFGSFESIRPTENHIKQLQASSLNTAKRTRTTGGHYNKVPKHVEAFGQDGKSMGVVFETATPFETPGWMKESVDWFNQSVSEERHHPLILIGIFIVIFLAIHPIKDGNGGLSRILTTLLLLRAECR